MKYILGIDIGTTSLKAALFDADLQAVGRAKVGYSTVYPAPGWAEQDPRQWWDAMKTALGSLYSAPGAPEPADLAIIAIDAMTPTMVPVDAQGRALRNALIWMDRRAEVESQAIDEALGDDLFRIAGNVSDPSNFAPKARWLKDREPEIYARTARLLFANGYLVHRLTGVFSADASNCGMSLLCDTVESRWSPRLIDGSGLDRDRLPDIYECTDVVGTVSTAAARELGIREGTRVIAGAMDNVAAVMGTGTFGNLELCLSAGTATNVNLCADAAHFDPSFLVYRHLIPGMWIHAGGVDYGGAGYKWFAGLIHESDYAALDRRAADAVPGARPLLFLPYMVGQRAPLWNSHTRGVLFGLDPSMNDGELARAFMEGNAFGVRKILGLMTNLGVAPESCRLTGGCADSRVYSQIFADVLEVPIERIGEADTATLGMAMAGAYAEGLAPDIRTFKDRVSIRGTQRPDADLSAHYERAFRLYARLYESLIPSFEDLSALARSEES